MRFTAHRHGVGTGLNERGKSLIEAVYQILGSPTRAPGYWVRPGLAKLDPAKAEFRVKFGVLRSAVGVRRPNLLCQASLSRALR